MIEKRERGMVTCGGKRNSVAKTHKEKKKQRRERKKMQIN